MEIKKVTYDELKAMGAVTGLFRMTEEDYRSFPALNQSSLKLLLSKTPAHFKEAYGKPSKDTPALRFGRDVHMLYGEPDLFYESYVREPGIEGSRSSKKYKDALNAFLDEHPGKEIMKAEDWDKAHALVGRLNSEAHTALITNALESELCCFWFCPERCLQFKSRLDSLNPRYVVDLKTTLSAEPKDFKYSVKKYDYDFQAAFYLWGLSMVDPTSIHGFRFIAVEKEPPYECAVYECSKDTVNRGWNKVEKALDIYMECAKNDQWPGYGTEIRLV